MKNLLEFIAIVLMIPFLIIHTIWFLISAILIFPTILIVSYLDNDSISDHYWVFYEWVFGIK